MRPADEQDAQHEQDHQEDAGQQPSPNPVPSDPHERELPDETPTYGDEGGGGDLIPSDDEREL
jgi:hypothetical protein